MRRGTTPTHIFLTDLDLTDAEVIYLTYQMNGKTIMEKTREELEVTAESISFKLTQEETLALRTGSGNVWMQIRARFPDGSAIASQVMSAGVDRILKEGVI